LVSAAVACQDGPAGDSGVSTDEKVGQHVALGATTAPVLGECLARQEQRGTRHLDHGQLHPSQHLVQCLDGGEGERQLGIDHRVDDQPVHARLLAQLPD